MTPPIDPFYYRVARIALSVVAEHGFALGGGLALIARGVLDRPTQDVDLFSDRDNSVRQAADLVRAALEADGGPRPTRADSGPAAWVGASGPCAGATSVTVGFDGRRQHCGRFS